MKAIKSLTYIQKTAVYLGKRCPTSSNNGRSPYKVFSGQTKPRSSRRFSPLKLRSQEVCKKHQVGQNRNKAKLLGCDDDSKDYLMMDTVTQKVVEARSVTS